MEFLTLTLPADLSADLFRLADAAGCGPEAIVERILRDEVAAELFDVFPMRRPYGDLAR